MQECLDVRSELLSRGVALISIDTERAHANAVEAWMYVRIDYARCDNWVPPEQLLKHDGFFHSVPQPAPNHSLPEKNSNGKQVGTPVHRATVAPSLFRRHELNLALHPPDPGVNGSI